MATVTDPERLNGLNEITTVKKDKDLGFYTSPLDVLVDIVGYTLRDPDQEHKPYISGNGYPYGYRPFGNLLFRPILDLPFMNFASSWFTMQDAKWPKHCQIMERDYMRCLSRVGLQNSKRWCQVYWEDVFECAHHVKSKKRRLYMDKVRKNKNVPHMEDVPIAIR